MPDRQEYGLEVVMEISKDGSHLNGELAQVSGLDTRVLTGSRVTPLSSGQVASSARS